MNLPSAVVAENSFFSHRLEKGRLFITIDIISKLGKNYASFEYDVEKRVLAATITARYKNSIRQLCDFAFSSSLAYLACFENIHLNSFGEDEIATA